MGADEVARLFTYSVRHRRVLLLSFLFLCRLVLTFGSVPGVLSFLSADRVLIPFPVDTVCACASLPISTGIEFQFP